MPEFPAHAQRYQDIHHCPRCGVAYRHGDFDAGACVFVCAPCGFAFYQNPVPAAVTVVVDPDRPGTVLMLRRRTPPRVGKWCVPGGFVGYGEMPAAAAARETREEVGIDVDITGLLDAGLVDYRFQGRQLCVLEIAFLAVPKAPIQVDRLSSPEASEVAFLRVDELLASPDLLAFPEQVRLLSMLRAPQQP